MESSKGAEAKVTIIYKPISDLLQSDVTNGRWKLNKSCKRKGRKSTRLRPHKQSDVKRRESSYEIHACDLCHKRFMRKESLTRHMKTHHKDTHSNCSSLELAVDVEPDDDFSDSDGPSLTNKPERVPKRPKVGNKRRTYECTMCSRKYKHYSRLSIHISVCHLGERPPFSCFECNRGFCDASSLKRHASVAHVTDDQKPVFRCEVCGKELSTMQSLGKHTKRHSGALFYRCSHCGDSFEKQGDRITHIQRMHAAERPHACEQCGQRFAELHVLRRHEKKHEERENINIDASYKSYCCCECLKTFTSAPRLRAHLERHAEQYTSIAKNTEKMSTCKICGRETKYLSQHMKIHEDFKRFTCSNCDKQFRHLYNLKVHMRVAHSYERPFMCDQCELTFATGAFLKRHYLSKHTNPGDTNGSNLRCPICSKLFSSANSNNLRRHVMAVHENVKPHACDRCGKTFAQLVNLRSHMRLHTGERPYECSTCGKRFVQSSSMKVHIRRHGASELHGYI